MVTLALIGAGKWGQNYLHAASNLKNIKIKYICAKSQQTLDSLPNTYQKTLSIQDLIKNKDVDGFIIASPAITHFAIASELLSLGHNLLIEKPLTTNLNDALKLQKIWQLKKPKVVVGHLYLYNPAYQVFKKHFNNLKNIKSISFEGLNSTIRKDISVIWDWGPHPLSILLDLIKQPVIEVSATGSIQNPDNKVYDTVNASIKFTSGIKATIHISWLGPNKVRRLTATGEDERIELDDTNTTRQKVLLQKPNKLPQYPKYNPEPALTKQLLEFANSITSLAKITSDINMGVSVVKILSAIEKSVEKEGQLVKLH